MFTGGPTSSLVKSIFISHANEDPDADPILHALTSGLKHALGPSHDAYHVAYDREIVAGKEWRREIYNMLFDCPAAIILISKKALSNDHVWVAFETSFLSVDKIRRKELCIIPVWLDGVSEDTIRGSKYFSTGRLLDFQALRYPAPSLSTPQDLVAAIAARIRKDLPPFGARQLIGLAAELRERLLAFPEKAREAAAVIFESATSAEDSVGLTEAFLSAKDNEIQRAFYALCNKARTAQSFQLKTEFATIIGAQQIPEDNAKPMAVEAAIPLEAECRRPLLLDSEDADILELYLVRASRRVPHAWYVTDANVVLEYGLIDDIKKCVRKIIVSKYGALSNQSQDQQLRRANSVIAFHRRSGFPDLLRMDYPADFDPATVFNAISQVCPELMVLYTASPDTPQKPTPACCSVVSVGTDEYQQLIGTYGALMSHCKTTTPKQEGLT